MPHNRQSCSSGCEEIVLDGQLECIAANITNEAAYKAILCGVTVSRYAARPDLAVILGSGQGNPIAEDEDHSSLTLILSPLRLYTDLRAVLTGAQAI